MDPADPPEPHDIATGARPLGAKERAAGGVSAAGHQAELRCVFCDYDLAGTPVDGCCPECGRAVRLSAEPDWIRLSSREELQRLARACVGAWALPLFGAGFVVLMLLAGFAGTDRASGATLGACSGTVGLVAAGASTWSWRRLLSRLEGVPFRPGAWGVLSVITGGLATLGPVLWMLGMWLEASLDSGAGLAAGGVLGMVGFGAIHIACALGGLGRRFDFMHRERSARWARIFGWCALGPIGIVGAGLMALVVALSNIGGGPGPGQTERAVAAVAMVVFFASWAPSLAALIGGGVLVNKFRLLVESALLSAVGEEMADADEARAESAAPEVGTGST